MKVGELQLILEGFDPDSEFKTYILDDRYVALFVEGVQMALLPDSADINTALKHRLNPLERAINELELEINHLKRQKQLKTKAATVTRQVKMKPS